MSAVEQFVDSEGNRWVAVSGPEYIDGAQGQKLLDAASIALRNGVVHLALDLSGTRVVNSVGVSRLIEIVETFGSADGEVAICTSQPIVTKTLQIMGLAAKVRMFGSLDEMTAGLTGKG